MKFSVTILGTNAALPGPDTITTSIILNAHDQFYVFDCGEGMQSKLMKYGFKRNKIQSIFISHLHGDHLFGLPGILTSFGHFQRSKPLYIFGPKGIKEYIDVMMRISHSYTEFEVIVKEMTHEGNQVIYEDAKVKVSAFPLKHRITTYGFRLDERPRSTNLIKEKLDEYRITVDQIKEIIAGNDVILEGQRVSHEVFKYRKNSARSFAYCSDTEYYPEIIPHIKHVDILYHEATYITSLLEKAALYGHSTAAQAAEIAKMAEVKKLILGHFSVRYEVKHAFREDAEEIFNPVIIAEEGMEVEVKT